MRGVTVGLVMLAWTSTVSGQEVNLQLARYADLVQTVKRSAGRVVLVDFWFQSCIPCKRGFPHLIGLHTKYAPDGLTAISVNVDDPTDVDAQQAALTFLREQQAGCLNLMLNESPDTWVPRLKIQELPCVFLFDRGGRLLERWDGGEVDYGKIEQRVVQALDDEHSSLKE